jgi:hypothetical protein
MILSRDTDMSVVTPCRSTLPSAERSLPFRLADVLSVRSRLRRSVTPPLGPLIEPHGGHVVEEFFDIDWSRSIAPSADPGRSPLLAASADPLRGLVVALAHNPGHQGHTAERRWRLRPNTQTPNISAFKRLITSRYGFNDEVPHRDLLYEALGEDGTLLDLIIED